MRLAVKGASSAAKSPSMSNWTFVGVEASRRARRCVSCNDARRRLAAVHAHRPARGRAPARAGRPAAAPRRGSRSPPSVIQIVIISMLPGRHRGLQRGRSTSPPTSCSARSLVANRHIPGVLVIALGGAAELRRHRESTAASCRPTRTRSRRPASPTRPSFINSAAHQRPAARVPRRHLPHARVVADRQRLQRRRHR